MAGSFAYFGTYTVNEPERTFTVHYEALRWPLDQRVDHITPERRRPKTRRR